MAASLKDLEQMAHAPAAGEQARVLFQGFPFPVACREVTPGIVLAVAHQSTRHGPPSGCVAEFRR